MGDDTNACPCPDCGADDWQIAGPFYADRWKVCRVCGYESPDYLPSRAHCERLRALEGL